MLLYAARTCWFAKRRVVIGQARLQERDIHVIGPRDAKLAYIPIPKNACTSIKTALFDAFSPSRNTLLHEWERNHVHRFFHRRPDAWMTVDNLRDFKGFRFTVLRHPFDRFLSTYRNRILKFRDIEVDPLSRMQARLRGLEISPSLDQFARRLAAYAAINGSISHHTRPQSHFVKDRNIIDQAYTVGELDRLVHDVSERAGVTLQIERRNTSAETSLHLSSPARKALEAYYREDFEMFPELRT